VNLKGEYGPPWDGPVVNLVKQREGEEKDKMAVDEGSDVIEEATKEGMPSSLRYPFGSMLTGGLSTFITHSGHCSSHLLGLAYLQTQESFLSSKVGEQGPTIPQGGHHKGVHHDGQQIHVSKQQQSHIVKFPDLSHSWIEMEM
jgi:hypothetical protein